MSALPRLLRPFAAALALGGAGVAAAQAPLLKSSPFMSSGGPVQASASPASEAYQFAGVSTVGKTTYVSLFDTQSKKGRWIPLGTEVDGIKVLTYDAPRDQVVVHIGGVEKLLTLRKAHGTANAPSAVAALPSPTAGFAIPPPAAFAPPVPLPGAAQPADAVAAKPPAPQLYEGQAKQEQEARMLVSDLLEIGMAQRKAYEEAQKKSSEQPAPPSLPRG